MRYVNPALEPMPVAINYSTIPVAMASLFNTAAPVVSDDIYKGLVVTGTVSENTVVEALKRKYKEKCGYCETYESDPNVEHHRPKGFVSDRIPKNNGYYWLAYEWTNLIASCVTCNSRKYKGTRFPVRKLPGNSTPPLLPDGRHDLNSFRYDSAYNLGEKAYILHPEYCINPEKHFYFDTEGKIYHRTDEGEYSISVYGLDRKTLNVNRKDIYNDLMNNLKNLVRKRFRSDNRWTYEAFTEGVGDILGEIAIRRDDPTRSYTLFTKYLLDHLNEFFIRPFPILEVRSEIRNAFRDELAARGLQIVVQ
jgi:uncharacterized protein (TIGR02646 family)